MPSQKSRSRVSLEEAHKYCARIIEALAPEIQCLLKVKEVLSKGLIFQDAKNNVSNPLKSK